MLKYRLYALCFFLGTDCMPLIDFCLGTNCIPSASAWAQAVCLLLLLEHQLYTLCFMEPTQPWGLGANCSQL